MTSFFSYLKIPFTYLFSKHIVEYESICVGVLDGNITLKWMDADVFIYEPDEISPFSFTRYNGQKIIPRKMVTDGGSIPRPLWALKSYSPWGYAPAFIIHDWIFETNMCRLDEDYTFNESILIFAEVLKTLMEKDHTINTMIFNTMVYAIGSDISKDVWNSDCVTPRHIQSTYVYEYTIHCS